jgi:hypothetical protein
VSIPTPDTAPVTNPAEAPSAPDIMAELRTGLAALTATVESLKTTVADVQKTLRFVYGAALVVVGAVGGPSAVTAIIGK